MLFRSAAQPFDQVKSAIRNVLLRKKVQELLEKVRGSSRVEIVDEDLKKYAEEAAKQAKLLQDKMSGKAGAASAEDGAPSGKGDLQAPE